MDVYQAAQQYKRQLLRREQDALREIRASYQASLSRIDAQLAVLQARIAEAQAAGEQPKPAWLFQQESYQDLQRLILQELAQFSGSVDGVLTRAQQAAIAAALTDSRALALLQLGRHAASVASQWVSLDTSAVRFITGSTLRGPLRDLLEGIAPLGWADARKALIVGVALHDNPRKTASAVRAALGSSLNRAETITRTETLRAYREATRESIQANPEILDGWVWLSAMDKRTCPYCWAMTGTFHDAGEVMATHPNCRCSPVPSTRPWIDLLGPELGGGILETNAASRVPDGAERFATANANTQRAVLGPAAYAEYERGDLQLSDLVGQRRTVRWGPTGYTRSLKQVHASR